MLKRLLCCAYFVMIGISPLFAQQSVKLAQKIEWQGVIDVPSFEDGVNLKTLSCDPCSIDEAQNFLPLFSTTIPLNTVGKISAKISNAAFSNSNLQENSNFDDFIQIVIEPKVVLTFERKKPMAVVSFVPLLRDEMGRIQQLTSFDLLITVKLNPNQLALRTPTTTDNSILNQGTFYKLSVTNEGVYKIDQAFLESLDISLSSVNMNNIRIYGNGGGMLPELAGAERQDDLLENAIQVVDNNNNNAFDEDDYVLFFGESPNQWVWNQEELFFDHKLHLYSKENHYFLNFDIGAGKRIANATQPTNHTTTSNSFDGLSFHEQESFNKMGSGRRWVGDQMTAGGSKTFSFSFPNRVKDEPVRIASRVAATTETEGARNVFNLMANGVGLHIYDLGSVSGGLESAVGRYDVHVDLLNTTVDNVNLSIAYSNPGSNDGTGWVDYLALNARRNLDLSSGSLMSGQLVWRDQYSVGEGNITRFDVASPIGGLVIWDVTNLDNIQRMQLQEGHFTASTDILRKFVAFNGVNFFVPKVVGQINKQNLHETELVNMLIVSHPDFISQAQDLANFHESEDGLTVKVVNVFDVYNEFSSGNQDIAAIRDYVKLHYDRGEELKYLLLFGDASYDYKNISYVEGNSNFVPIYQTEHSGFSSESSSYASSTPSYCSDDFYGLLDDTDGTNIGEGAAKLDIGVGRFPVQTLSEAIAMVSKIKHYKTTRGNWLNNITFIADDGNSNLHMEHTESHSKLLGDSAQVYNIDKIYLDAFQQVAGQGGDRYPDVNKALEDKIFSGTFIMNYVGHGKATGLSKEQIIDIPMIQNMENKDKLPLFITATCTFSRFDDPEVNSAGEELLINPNGGAVSIVSTVRIVGAYGNKQINEAFLKEAFKPLEDGRMPTLGEIMTQAKNKLNGSATNFRKFVLLGDPALTLNYPEHKVLTTSIKNETLNEENDTIEALSKITITGRIVDDSNQIIENFNGQITPILYDKSLDLSTLGNDRPSNYDTDNPDSCPSGSGNDERDEVSCPTEFGLRQSTIFKGNASVVEGEFQFTFIVPKDISYKYGKGKLSYYAESDWTDAAGWDTTIVVGGISDLVGEDTEGPDVEIFLNDENFVFGGLTGEDPILLVNLSDEHGINTVGTGIGHDLVAKMDEESEQQQFVLNNYYESTLDNFQEGKISYPLTNLKPGLHTVRIKAWDVFNNSGEGYTEFLVAESAQMALQNVLNYPNPFTDQTSFWFEHNRVGDVLNVQIQVFTLSGRLVKTIQDEFVASGNRVSHLNWDGLDEFGNSIGKGVYVYQVKVRAASDNSVINELQKLVLLK